MNSQTHNPENGACVNIADANGEKSITMKWLCIDKTTIRYKIHYILWAGGQGTVSPCIAVFAKNRLRLSPASFAALTMVQQFMLILVKPALGYVVDYFNKLKAVIWVLTMLYLISLCLLLFVPAIPKTVWTDRHETSFEKLDSCNLRRNFTNYSNQVLIPLNKQEMYTSLYKNSTLITEKNNCSNLFENFINGTLSAAFYSNKTYSMHLTMNGTIDELHSLLEKGCQKSELCNPNSYPYSVTIEHCVFCCESRGECYAMSEIPTEDGKFNNTETKSDGSDFEFYQFWMFAFLYVVIYTCSSSIFTLTDTACYETVEKLGKDFGRERLWGALGWGLFAPIGGILDDLTEDYLAASVICGIMTLLMLLNLSKMDLVKPHFCKNILKDVGTVVKSRSFLYFFMGTVVNGIGYGIVWYYLIWHVVSIGGDRLICGLVHAIQCCAGEIPFMFCSGWMLNKVGYFHVTTLALLASCVRFFWYSQLQNPWLILLTEWTHGITYGLFYTSMASFSKVNAKPGTEATTQAIIMSGYEGLGSGLGNVVAGVGFNYVGGHQTFFYCGAFFGLCILINIGYTIFDRYSGNIMPTRKKSINTVC